jgi:hypothetical protein
MTMMVISRRLSSLHGSISRPRSRKNAGSVAGGSKRVNAARRNAA